MADRESIEGGGLRIGYARVSTLEQDTALQLAALRRAGVHLFFEEKASGVKARPELERLLTLLRPGDELVIYKLDRLARSLADLLRIHQRVGVAGASLRSVSESVETGSAVGRAMFQLLGVFAELERSVIRERCQAGARAAVARGVRLGRKTIFDANEARRLRDQGLTYREVASRLGVSHSGVVKALTGSGRAAPGRVAYGLAEGNLSAALLPARAAA